MPVRSICEDIADAAGLNWQECGVAIEQDQAPASPVDKLDPFFESQGQWNSRMRIVTLFHNRCAGSADRFRVSTETLMRVVAIHFLAHAVIRLGKHPDTGLEYIDAENPAKTYAYEERSRQVTHAHYGGLRREEEFFTQVFTYVYLRTTSDTEELKVFELLSRGHAGLYSLAPEPPALPLLQRDWKAEISANPAKGRADAAAVLGHLTRAAPLVTQ